jgi:hypothetical protein
MSDMQLPTVAPLWALPAAKVGALKHMATAVTAKKAFLILISLFWFVSVSGLPEAASGRRQGYEPSCSVATDLAGCA